MYYRTINEAETAMSLSFYAPFTPYIMRNKILEVFIMKKVLNYLKEERTITTGGVLLLEAAALYLYGSMVFMEKQWKKADDRARRLQTKIDYMEYYDDKEEN